ncbi:major facilitator superfamily domain-containing protein [Mycena pura]|uniref:Major facilitator superfamily domain-containing protein n=1 Tax=Mycena pura TaxID=153505 RepID=A0AAD6Y4W0_9AGAR|nr:major facilitator superfamily domain-containing protein [Mycena pura]
MREDEEEQKARQKMHPWKRPAPWWLMVLALSNSVVQSGTAGVQIELFTNLACRRLQRPESMQESIALIDTYSLSQNNLSDLSPSFNIVDNHQILRAAFLVPESAITPCSSDPTAQAEVAKLSAVIATLAGLTSLATAAWWGSFSDRHGRTRVMGISAIGNTITSLSLVFVALYAERIPGGYWSPMIINAIISGVLGGGASSFAAPRAYLVDITTPENRSRTFSIVLGLALVGVAIGPILGSFVLRVTNHNILSVLYMATALTLIQTFFIWFVLPESLTVAQKRRASTRYKESPRSVDGRPRTCLTQLKYTFLEPLAVLFPERGSSGERRDWNLLMLATADGLMLLAATSTLGQFLYAISTFQWDAEYLGYCLSSIGFARATYLVLILPPVIEFAKNRRKNASAPSVSSESQPLLPDQDSTSRPSQRKAHESVFDLALARFSILVNTITFAILPFAPTGAIFILFISLGSFGSGLSPAVSSLAMELYTQKVVKDGRPVEAGKLYGAMSVVQAVFESVLGPPLYGLVYTATAATYPRAVFFVALGNAFVALTLLGFVRLPSDRIDDRADMT